LYALADIRSYEESLMEEDSVIFRICIWCGTFCMEMVDAYILKFSCFTSSAEGFDKDTWSAGNAAEVDMIA
jgi:hypothetical protein